MRGRVGARALIPVAPHKHKHVQFIWVCGHLRLESREYTQPSAHAMAASSSGRAAENAASSGAVSAVDMDIDVKYTPLATIDPLPSADQAVMRSARAAARDKAMVHEPRNVEHVAERENLDDEDPEWVGLSDHTHTHTQES